MLDEDSYLFYFPFEGESLRAEATFVRGAEILIGTRLLRRHRLEIDFVSGSVILDRTGLGVG